MQVFKTSGQTIDSVIANKCHAFRHRPKMEIGEIVLISKNVADLSKGEKQIGHYAVLDSIEEATDQELERLWPGNRGRWNYIVRFASIVELEKPFDLSDVLGHAVAKHYSPVVTSAPVQPKDVGKINIHIHAIERDEIKGTEFERGAFREGTVTTVLVNRFERDKKARAACILKHGYSCKICGDLLANRYGKLAEGFIHVHHIVPLSGIRADYSVDPEKDLIPVCPNCHSMLHQTTPPLTPEALRGRLK